MEMEIVPRSPQETPPVSDAEEEAYEPRSEKQIEEIFEKEPKKEKPKRVLTDKQKEALQRGREKAKAKRMAKLKAEVEEKMKKEKPISRKNKEPTNKPSSKRDEVLSRIRAKSEAKNKVAIENFERIKWSVLENLEDENTFIDLENILNTIPKRDYSNPDKIVARLQAYHDHYCSKK